MDLEKLKSEQRKLASKVILKDTVKNPKIIAAADQAYLDQDTILAAIVVIDLRTKEIIEQKYTQMRCPIKYIPGFLSYRESPAIVETYSKLESDFDLLIVEGNGILHPRKLGIASQIGISIGKPTIGVAKSLLCGEVDGDSVILDKEVVGKVIQPYEHTKDLYVSPGHMMTLKRSVDIVKSLIEKPYKLPYPLAMANKYANKLKRRLKNSDKNNLVN